MNPEQMHELIEEIARSKGVSHEAVLEALKGAIERSYIKYLGGGDDAVVEIIFDEETGEIALGQKKAIVKEEDIEDDYLQTCVEDATEEMNEQIEHIKEEISYCKKKDEEKKRDLKMFLARVEAQKKGIKKAKEYVSYVFPSEIGKLVAIAIKNNLRIRLAEAERVALYDIYKDQIGELITGRVESTADRGGYIVNIGKTNVELSKKALIGDETFRVGEPIKVYIQEVKDAPSATKTPRGSQIEVTRSSEGFLRRLFESEIHEVYDGTIVIKGIAREAGVRSKVAVASTNEDVDPAGACIGRGGNNIQKIIAYLGNAKEKEKIDIIAWSENPALFIAEALRPANVIGVAVMEAEEEGEKSGAIAIIKDDELSTAIGKRGANARLANQLTGYAIDIVPESVAAKEGLVYDTVETLREQEEENKRKKANELFAQKNRLQEALKKEEQAKPVAPAEKPVEEKPVEQKVEETPVVEEKKEPVETISVKTTTTLEDLEKGLSAEANKPQRKSDSKKSQPAKKKPHRISDDEAAQNKPTETQIPTNMMPIYTEEELAEIEEEENLDEVDDNSYDDVDLDDYDSYYDN